MANVVDVPESAVPRVIFYGKGYFLQRSNGTYEYVPITMEDGPWLSVRETAQLLGWRTGRVYDFLGDLLVYSRPLPHKRLVLLKSVLKLKSESSAAGFWRDLAKQNAIREWVYGEMCKPSETVFQ